MEWPCASVIIPTRNRSGLLRRCLEALANQTARPGTFDVMVVDNGSSDDTMMTLEAARRAYPQLQLHWTHELRQGPGAARNRGLMHARGEIILFTDDDCIPARNWVEVMLQTFDRELELAGIEGLTYTELDRFSPFLHFAANDGGVYPTCNIGYRADIVRSVGGFDVRAFPDCSAEDVDLGCRVLERGPIRFEPAARVFHPPRAVGFWWQVARGRFLVRDELCLRRRFPWRYDSRNGPFVRKRPPDRLPGEPLRITSLDVTTALFMLLHSGLARRPGLYAKYVAMLALRTSYALALLPLSMRHARRHSDPHTLPPLRHVVE